MEVGKRSKAFTIVELLVVLVTLMVIFTITWTVSSGYRQAARDAERVSDVAGIKLALERYYRTAGVGTNGASYPSTAQIGSTTFLDSLFDNSSSNTSLYAPDATTISLVVATTAASPQSPTVAQYIYQPLTSASVPTLCTVDGTCVRYVLYYQTERSASVVAVDSMRQQ